MGLTDRITLIVVCRSNSPCTHRDVRIPGQIIPGQWRDLDAGGLSGNDKAVAFPGKGESVGSRVTAYRFDSRAIRFEAKPADREIDLLV